MPVLDADRLGSNLGWSPTHHETWASYLTPEPSTPHLKSGAMAQTALHTSPSPPLYHSKI